MNSSAGCPASTTAKRNKSPKWGMRQGIGLCWWPRQRYEGFSSEDPKCLCWEHPPGCPWTHRSDGTQRWPHQAPGTAPSKAERKPSTCISSMLFPKRLLPSGPLAAISKFLQREPRAVHWKWKKKKEKMTQLRQNETARIKHRCRGLQTSTIRP